VYALYESLYPAIGLTCDAIAQKNREAAERYVSDMIRGFYKSVLFPSEPDDFPKVNLPEFG
jgi:hypothetical protein